MSAPQYSPSCVTKEPHFYVIMLPSVRHDILPGWLLLLQVHNMSHMCRGREGFYDRSLLIREQQELSMMSASQQVLNPGAQPLSFEPPWYSIASSQIGRGLPNQVTNQVIQNHGTNQVSTIFRDNWNDGMFSQPQSQSQDPWHSSVSSLVVGGLSNQVTDRVVQNNGTNQASATIFGNNRPAGMYGQPQSQSQQENDFPSAYDNSFNTEGN